MLTRGEEDRGLSHMHDLHGDIEFAEPSRLCNGRRLTFDFVFVKLRDVADMADPVVDDTALGWRERCVYAAASVVSADDDVLDLEDIHGKIEHREAVEVAVDDEIRHIPVDEHFAWWKSNDFVRWDSAIGATDPQVARLLLRCEAFKKAGSLAFHTLSPRAVVVEEVQQTRHSNIVVETPRISNPSACEQAWPTVSEVAEMAYSYRMASHLPAFLIERLSRLEIEIPTWGFADTGTRFGKFLQDAAALTIEDKLDDAAQVHRLTGSCPAVAIHALWDIPVDGAAFLSAAVRARGLRVGSINPNVFEGQCYKHGSIANEDASVRKVAIDHIVESCALGRTLGSRALTLWFADGTNYPGQGSFARRKRWFMDALREVHSHVASDAQMLVEYKPFEPAFYHTDIADWGMAYVLAKHAGPRAKVLVDIGHHLPGQNVEHIVSFLADEDMLGGFHFNDRHYADDDLTTGSIDPYRVFRIFVAIAEAERALGRDLPIEYMIDQSHNVKPKIEAMIQTVTTVQELFAKALLVDLGTLNAARELNDVVAAEECMKSAFATDVREALGEWRVGRGLPRDPLVAHRGSGYEAAAAADRIARKRTFGGSYA